MALELNVTDLLNDTNLKAYYRMESNVNEASPDGYNLTAVNSPTYEAGQFGNAIKLARASSMYASIVNASCPNLNISSDMTLFGWAKLASLGNAVATILSKFNNANQGYILYVDSNNKVNFTCSGLASNTNVTSNTVLTTGTFYFIVGVYNSTTQKLSIYINGVLDNSVAASGSIQTNTVPFAAGASFQGGGDTAANFLDGDIDDAAVFNRVLSTDEILGIYDESFGAKRSYSYLM